MSGSRGLRPGPVCRPRKQTHAVSPGVPHARRIRRSPAHLQPQARRRRLRAAVPRRGLRHRHGDDRQPGERHGDRRPERPNRARPGAARRDEDGVGQHLARVRHGRPGARPSLRSRRAGDPRDRAIRRGHGGSAPRPQARGLQARARRFPLPAGLRSAARSVRRREAQHQRTRPRPVARPRRAPEAATRASSSPRSSRPRPTTSSASRPAATCSRGTSSAGRRSPAPAVSPPTASRSCRWPPSSTTPTFSSTRSSR